MSRSILIKKKFYHFLFVLLLCLACILLPSCKKEFDYFSYVSELRNNIFLADTEGFSIRIYSVRKENPYCADGIPQESSARTEIYLLPPSGAENCTISFTVDGKEYGGEMSFDNVKTEYFLSCTLDVSSCTSLPCVITYGEQILELQANSVLSKKEIPPQTLLSKLQAENTELFSSMTDKYGFAGEIYIRLIFEENPYYYVGVIDRDGNISAFLVNALTGKTLAKRKS